MAALDPGAVGVSVSPGYVAITSGCTQGRPRAGAAPSA
jgi:hypothetical protein